jgi:hypothetical protein
MQVELLKRLGTWMDVKYAARTTVNKDGDEFQEPTSLWKKRMLLAEHSPIRKLIFNWKWCGLLWWVQTHFTRHKFGVEWFVSTSREDRTGVPRDLPDSQNNPVDVEGFANAQAVINISRKRLCNKASLKTQIAWQKFLLTIKDSEPELFAVCVPNCVYRGYCYEMESCGFYKTPSYEAWLSAYREGVRN